jgi:hypothetical protein
MSEIEIQNAVTCGIEYEFESSIPDKIMEVFNIKSWRTTHDASIESDGIFLNSLKIIIPKSDNKILRLLSYQNVTVGIELVSRILNSDESDLFEQIKLITNIATSLGEPSETQRSGIHFHFSFSQPSLKMLKSIIRLAKYLESVFYYIGGMGYEFRGSNNDSIYCRPITKTGPSCVRLHNDEWAQVFNIYRLLETKNIEEFWDVYGNLNNHNRRYNPVRYHWINLFPMYPGPEYRGTLEFRVFNKTQNPLYIYSCAMLCRKFIEYSIRSSFESLKEENLLKENSIFSNQSKEEIKETLIKFANLSELDSKSLSILLLIIDRTLEIRLDEGYVKSHIYLTPMARELNSYWGNSGYYPKTIPLSEIKNPEFLDIHQLRGES